MSDLIDTTEMYLRTIFELEEDGITPLRARIAERLQQSGPTVSQTVARMERDGLVVVTRDRHLELTPEGRAKATRVMRKHRLAERLLIDVIGLEWEYLHEEACRWEHVMSERVERHLLRLLDNPTESPFGNRIPGLEELGVPADLPAPADSRTVALADVPVSDGAVTMLVRRLGEPLQGEPDMMARLESLGIRPGRLVRVQRAGRSVQVAPPDGGGWTTLPDAIAGHLFVRPAGSGAATAEGPAAAAQ